MYNPIIFIHKSPDPQLNSTLEQIVLSLNNIGSVAHDYFEYRTSIYNNTIPNTTLTTLVNNTDYNIGNIQVYNTYNKVLLNVNCEVDFEFNSVNGNPSITLKIVKKLQSEPTYNFTNTIKTITYRSNNIYNGLSHYYTTFNLSNVYDFDSVNFYDYGIFISYNDNSTSITPISMNISNIDGNSIIIR